MAEEGVEVEFLSTVSGSLVMIGAGVTPLTKLHKASIRSLLGGATAILGSRGHS